MPAADAGPDVTRLLRDASAGNTEAFAQLVTRLYDELARLASQRLRHEAPGHTLNTTGLVHEAYLRLVDQTRIEWRNREHFFAVASDAMRRVLVDHARRRQRDKRGGGVTHVPLHDDLTPSIDSYLNTERADDIIALDEALQRLAHFNPAGARIVHLRFFGGLSNAEVAEVIESSERTVRRTWAMAKAWLRRELGAHAETLWIE
ncbi:MAG: sigma-70 family RNA polymerase sigma factor [Gemmatimonadaceae bacterium]|nr:sigma-70 family RNA polymerase sigma factor [Gemmatimonadaceae bacterium]